MARPLAIVGGILAISGVILSLFVLILGWFTFEVSGLGSSAVLSVTALGGSLDGSGTTSSTIASNNVLYILPGIIALIGSVLCFFPQRAGTITGGVLILGSLGLFIYALSAQWSTLYGGLVSFLNFSLWNTTTGFLGSVFYHLGYGFLITGIGGILSLIGSAGED